jgi:hypothetical protein
VQVIGTVVRLQVQRDRLKPGERGQRVYDPAPLLEVDALRVGPQGVVGLTPQGEVLDVHHAQHPNTRWVRPRSGLSFLPAAHTARLRDLYGPHLVTGIAGEGLTLATDGPLSEADLHGQLLLETDSEPLRLSEVAAMPPCVEFARWCLGLRPPVLDERVEAALETLGEGARGFGAVVTGSGVVRAGRRLYRA